MSIDWSGETVRISALSEIPAAEIVRGIAQADDDSLVDLHLAVQEVTVLFEKILSFLVENLKGVESIRDEWIDGHGFRASVAMLGAAVNHLLAARQLLMRGYSVESEFLLREVLDRATRAYLFRSDEIAAKRFLNGKQLRPSYVAKRLNRLFVENKAEDGLPFLAELRRKYEDYSKRGHANLDSFWFRTPGDHNARATDEDPVPALSGIVGTDVFVGGFRGPFMQALLMFRSLDLAIYAAWVFLAMSADPDGEWKQRYDELAAEYQGFRDQLNALAKA